MILRRQYFRSFAYLLSTVVVLVLFSNNTTAQTTNQVIPSGSYIINMGVEPQTVANGLKPYGLIYTLLREYQVPVKWSINPSKVKDGTDFTYNAVQYKGGPFIISAEYRNATVDSVIMAWNAKGVVGITTTSDFIAPIYTTLEYFLFWTLDAQNGGIAEGYLENAEIPTDGYNWVAVGDLTCCDDIFVMPHADPEWFDGLVLQHGRLFEWNNDIGLPNGCDGSIWAACHAVSALELMFNPSAPTQQTNFLSKKTGTATGGGPYSDPNNSLVEWGDHGEQGPPYVTSYPTHPVMQYLGTTDAAQQNGSEQSYMPVLGGGWRPSTLVAVEATTHPDKPSLTLGPVAKIAFGDAYGDATRGKVMYEAGHSHDGTAPANIAAQRAFFNFSFWSVQGKAIDVDMGSVPAALEGGKDVITLTATASGGTGTYTYRWISDCPGTFSNPFGQTTTFTPSFVTSAVTCAIKCVVEDECGTRSSFDSRAVTIVPAPQPPVAVNDLDFTNPAVPVTVAPLDNDTDLNLDIDPSTLMFLTPATTANGTFTINFDGTVTYVSNPMFMGMDTVQYKICDMTPGTETPPGPYCDTALIIITVDQTDEFGCTPFESYSKVYTGYAEDYTTNAFASAGYFALGYPEGRSINKPAVLNANATPASRGEITLTLAAPVLQGDMVTIYGWAQDGNPTSFKATSSADGITYGNEQNYTVPNSSQSYSFSYTSNDPDGIFFIRITNTNSSKSFRLDGISYDVKECRTVCTLPFVDLVISGNGIANLPAGSTAANPARALGLPNLDGSEVDNGEILYVDLGTVIPAGEIIQLFLANDSQSPEPTVDVSGSLDGTTWTNIINFIPQTDRNEAFDQMFYTVSTVTQLAGIRYLRFQGLVTKSYVDAVVFDIATCEDGIPVALNDTTYTVEGQPVTYPVQINDSDPQGGALTTTDITSPPSNGTAYINADGTITYVPDANFSGTDVLTYEICDATGLCDEATLTIIIPNDGCTDPADAEIVGFGYGFTAQGNAGTTAPERAVGIADGQYATVNSNETPNSNLVIKLSTTVFAGDTIFYTVSGQDADAADYTMSISTDSINFTGLSTRTVSGTVLTQYYYVVNNAAGANFIRFTSIDAADDLRVDGVRYLRRACLAACTGGAQYTTTNGYAVTATGDRSPLLLTGAPNFIGQEIRLADINPTIVDLGVVIPQGSYVYLFLANNGGAAGTLEVQKSLTNGSYANPSYFAPTSANAIFQQFSFIVTEASGIRYLRLDCTAGDRVFIDAIRYFSVICQPGAPIAVNDLAYTSEEQPVTYNVQINDSDPQGDDLTTTQVLSPPNNGSYIINVDGTITYTPDPEFTGNDTLTYQVCDPFNACDDALLIITVVSDGCSPGQTSIVIGTGYGLTATDPSNQVADEGNATGIPNTSYAGIAQNGNYTLEVFPSNTILAGETITFYASGQDGTPVDFTVEIWNGSSWVGAQAYSVSGNTSLMFTYFVNSSSGAQRIRFVNNSTGKELRIYGLSYDLRACVETGCVSSDSAFIQTGYPGEVTLAGVPITTVLGAPDAIEEEIRLANNDTVYIVFDNVIPEGAIIHYYISNNNAAVTGVVQSSLDGTSWGNNQSFTPPTLENGTNPSSDYQQLSYTVPAGGIQHLRFYVSSGDRYFLDAVQYTIYQYNSLSGYVWNDSSNENGLFDSGEPPYEDVTVQIYNDADESGTVNTGDVLVKTTTTDANGFYSYQFFATVLPSSYVIRIVESSLPASPTTNYYTTPQYQTATLTTTTDSDCDNNFGRSFDDPPLAVNDTDTTEQNLPVIINVYANDQNPDVNGEMTTVTSIASQPSVGGSVTINPDGTITYNPPVNFVGTETFSYILCDEADPGVLCDTATVTVVVLPFSNDPPVALDDSGTTEKDEPITVVVLANDSDPEGDAISPPTCVGTDASASTPTVCDGMTTQGGTVTVLPGGEIYYEPPAGFTGTDMTTYVICDPSGLCDEAVITFTVVDAINDPPVAGDDNPVIYLTCSTSTFSVVTNDFDTDSTLNLASVMIIDPLTPATGSLVNNFNGTFDYTPAGAGTFTFSYSICDNGTPLPAQCDTATVTITVPAGNDPPDAMDDGDAIYVNTVLTTSVLSNDSDPEGGVLSVTAGPAYTGNNGTSTQGGTIEVLISGKIRYTPPMNFIGTDTYTYQICDDHCTPLCDIATVTVTVENRPPVAVNDISTTAINVKDTIDVLVNDFDPDTGQTITLNNVGSNPLNATDGATTRGGMVSIVSGEVVYMPPNNFIGVDTFYYIICDSGIPSQCDTARVIVTITSPIDVSITKSVFPEFPEVGDTVSFTLVLANTSASLATGVIVRDKLPTGLVYVSDTGNGSYDSGSGIWYIGDVASGTTKTLIIRALVSNYIEATNTAQVIDHNEVDTDSTPNNNVDAEDDQSSVIIQCLLKERPITIIQN